jgi:hypothetical protein
MLTTQMINPMFIIGLLLSLTTPALADQIRCTTYEEKSLGRWQTLCDDGTRAASYWNRTFSRWESTVIPAPGKTCEGRLSPKTYRWEGRCR